MNQTFRNHNYLIKKLEYDSITQQNVLGPVRYDNRCSKHIYYQKQYGNLLH